ncbi:MAG: TonB-dependent receptor plug domain-containing protein [Gemmatimonadales bacterium]
MRLISLLLASSLVPELAAAQEPVPVEDIVVTANRLPLSAGSEPAAVTVLDGEELRRRGVRFVADALREVPSANVVSTGSWGGVSSLFMRGGESDYVKVLLDGVPLNAPGGAIDLAALTLDNIDRIEIVRGPASVVHGSDAVSGVVQLFSRRGGGPVAGAATITGGSYGTWVGEASATGGGSRVSASAGVSRTVTDGTYGFNSDFDNTVLSGRVGYAPAAATDIALAARWGDHSSHFPTDFAGLPVDSNQVTFERQLALSLDGGHRFSDLVEGRLALTFADADGGARNDSDSPGDTVGFAYASTQDRDASRLGADLRALLRPGAVITVSTGVALEREAESRTGESTSNFGSGAFTEPDVPFDESRTTASWYAQAAGDVLTPLTVTAGARVDDGDFGSFFTWRLGASFRAARETRLRGSVGTAFKAPSLAETFANSPFEVGNPELDPEQSRSWEVGVAQGLLAGVLTLEATWFDQHFKDLIQYQTAAPGEPTYFNLGEASARGLEVGLRVRPTSSVAVSAAYTRLDTEVTESGGGGSVAFQPGEPLLRRPSDAGTLGIDVWPAGAVRAGARVTWVGSREDVDFNAFPAERVTLGSDALVDLTLEVRPATSFPLAATLRLENALDEEYETIVGYPGRGRAVFLGVRAGR